MWIDVVLIDNVRTGFHSFIQSGYAINIPSIMKQIIRVDNYIFY